MSRTNISGNSSAEGFFAFSRAVRVGGAIHVAGTVATGDDGGIVGEGDFYAQAQQALRNIAAALDEAGASLSDVVRTRIFVTDIAGMRDVARAHREVFSEIRPASTLVAVTALADPALLVEIEADALVDSAAG